MLLELEYSELLFGILPFLSRLFDLTSNIQGPGFLKSLKRWRGAPSGPNLVQNHSLGEMKKELNVKNLY